MDWTTPAALAKHVLTPLLGSGSPSDALDFHLQVGERADEFATATSGNHLQMSGFCFTRRDGQSKVISGGGREGHGHLAQELFLGSPKIAYTREVAVGCTLFEFVSGDDPFSRDPETATKLIEMIGLVIRGRNPKVFGA
jgi:hypothetical protein